MAEVDSTNYTAARTLRAACISGLLFVAGVVCYANGNPDTVNNIPAPGQNSVGSTKSTSKVVNRPTWNELTPAQQQALAPLAAEWDKIEPVRKKKCMEISAKFARMSPGEQARLQERMRDWAKLTPEQRRIARESYARAKKLNADQKSAQWQQYQKLSEEQKKKLAADAASKQHIANLPAAHSKTKTVPPIKTAKPPAPSPTAQATQQSAGVQAPEATSENPLAPK